MSPRQCLLIFCSFVVCYFRLEKISFYKSIVETFHKILLYPFESDLQASKRLQSLLYFCFCQNYRLGEKSLVLRSKSWIFPIQPSFCMHSMKILVLSMSVYHLSCLQSQALLIPFELFFIISNYEPFHSTYSKRDKK